MNPFFTWAGYIGMIIVGGVAYFFPARKKELDVATQGLIRTLQESVIALQEQSLIHKDKIKELESHQRENIAEIAKIKTENLTMKEILQGRDEETKKFQVQGYASMDNIKKTLDMVERLVKVVEINTKGIDKNNEMTAELVKTLKEHFLTMERAAIS